MEALGEIMTVAPAGRLYKALVDTKKATGVDSWTFTLADPGAIMFWRAGRARGSRSSAARDAMLAALDGVAKQPITAEEVERVRAQGAEELRRAAQRPRAGRASSLSEAIAHGRLAPVLPLPRPLAEADGRGRAARGRGVPQAGEPHRRPVPPGSEARSRAGGGAGRRRGAGRRLQGRRRRSPPARRSTRRRRTSTRARSATRWATA
ncbi:MAG: hypothetical protein MZW92_32155 [Comamonadaceae bacterium]|nr:hypothetical protein [Comamonadaceae bacterium]